MKRSDFSFFLPENLIARYPLPSRRDSRLLVAYPIGKKIIDAKFNQLSTFLNVGDLLVFNDSRVISARLYGKKMTGGKVEILIERVLTAHRALVHLGSNKTVKPGQEFILMDGSKVKVLERQGRLFILQFDEDQPLLSRLKNIGRVPLPPYLKREDEPEDALRYQTVYARHEGSVAAPTAGLHFDERMLETLKQKGIESAFVTLHVGAGTFMPVQVEEVGKHVMHHEWISVEAETVDKIKAAKARGNKVIAVGTTSLRCLESAALEGELKPFLGETNIFIFPGFQFRVADALITNFHLPESTLLMLVAAFVGLDFTKEIYHHAIEHKYRFYSYGDASFLRKNSHV